AATGPDGRIYAIGGVNDHATGFTLNTVEAYSLITHSWSPVASMSSPRRYLSAATGPDGRIYVFGGTDDNFNFLNTVEAYNVFTNTWSPVASMSTARIAAAAAVGSD